jgi:hypothetical protein
LLTLPSFSTRTPSRRTCDNDVNTPSFEELTAGWTSNLNNMQKIMHTDVENYLINSRHRTVDRKKMLPNHTYTNPAGQVHEAFTMVTGTVLVKRIHRV